MRKRQEKAKKAALPSSAFAGSMVRPIFRSHKTAFSEFREWATLFSGDIFVKVIAYIDESGSHDRTGEQKASEVVVISGLVAWKDDWAKFSEQWQKALNKYSADLFHFAELAAASRVIRKIIKPPKDFDKNPYRDWDLSKIDAFLYEMAEIAGEGNKVGVGALVETRRFNDAKKNKNPDVPKHGDPYRHCADMFFQNLPKEILSAWPYWSEPVTIFYDWLEESEKLRQALFDAHAKYRKLDSRIAELSFVDKRNPLHLPLQAADMAAYRFRQIAENLLIKREIPDKMPKLDDLLLKHMFGQFAKFGPPTYM